MYSAEAKLPSTPKTQCDVLQQFPPDYRRYLTVDGDKITSQYTSKEIWTEINQVARGLGYSWVSAGKESHWKKVKW
jgi:hypothetical protein